MARIFDLSEVVPGNRYQVAEQTFYLLWEVFARQPLPDIADIPGSSVVIVHHFTGTAS